MHGAPWEPQKLYYTHGFVYQRMKLFHDLHTAGLIGAVKLLCAQKEHLLGDVTFMFQPGEEAHEPGN